MPLNFGKMNSKPDDEDPQLTDHAAELVKSSNQPAPAQNPFLNNDSTFAAIFEEDDEESAALLEAKGANTQAMNRYESGTIEKQLENNIRELRKEYPMGGVRASRFITADILMNAPADYFDRYDEVVKKGVDWVQSMIADAGNSGIIGAAQDEPTDDARQDEAYRIVQAAASEYMGKYSSFMGVEKAIVISLMCNEIIGFSKLDPLWRSLKVDEIICNGPKDVQVEIRGKLYRVPACRFRDKDHLQGLIERLYGAIGKLVSKTTPIVDGRLHDNSRMAVVHTSVAPDGPNFSIRRHKADYISPQQLMEWGTANEEVMTYLGNLLYKGCSALILGGTSSGKTTLLSALTGFIRPDHRILTLEDNLELKLAPGKMAAAGMECVPERPDRPGSGTNMRDLVKASLRLRPNAIVVGEVRDGAAYDLCQALNTGHYGMSTVHANSEYDGIYRLVSLVSQGGMIQNEGVLPLIAASFDIVVRIERFPSDGSRKIVSITEVAPFPERKESGELILPTKTLWKFVDEGLDEHFKVQGRWEQVGEMSEQRQELRRLKLEKDLTWEELSALVSPQKK